MKWVKPRLEEQACRACRAYRASRVPLQQPGFWHDRFVVGGDVGPYTGHIIIMGEYRDNGKENGSYYMGFKGLDIRIPITNPIKVRG